MWRNFRFLHIFYVEKCEITSHVETFQISPHLSCEINPHVMKFFISPHLSCIEIWNFSTWQIFSPRAPPVVPVTNMRYVYVCSNLQCFVSALQGLHCITLNAMQSLQYSALQCSQCLGAWTYIVHPLYCSAVHWPQRCVTSPMYPQSSAYNKLVHPESRFLQHVAPEQSTNP